MTPLSRYSIVFHSQVRQHLRFIEKKYQSEIKREIEEQLSFEPDKPTRNRKPLNKLVLLEGEWEMRCARIINFEFFIRSFRKIAW
jgi:hypothetical protein